MNSPDIQIPVNGLHAKLRFVFCILYSFVLNHQSYLVWLLFDRKVISLTFLFIFNSITRSLSFVSFVLFLSFLNFDFSKHITSLISYHKNINMEIRWVVVHLFCFLFTTHAFKFLSSSNFKIFTMLSRSLMMNMQKLGTLQKIFNLSKLKTW